jgi:hypothetical protein
MKPTKKNRRGIVPLILPIAVPKTVALAESAYLPDG